MEGKREPCVHPVNELIQEYNSPEKEPRYCDDKGRLGDSEMTLVMHSSEKSSVLSHCHGGSQHSCLLPPAGNHGIPDSCPAVPSSNFGIILSLKLAHLDGGPLGFPSLHLILRGILSNLCTTQISFQSSMFSHCLGGGACSLANPRSPLFMGTDLS